MSRMGVSAAIAVGACLVLAGMSPALAQQDQLRASLAQQFRLMGHDPQPVLAASADQLARVHLALSVDDETDAEKYERALSILRK